MHEKISSVKECFANTDSFRCQSLQLESFMHVSNTSHTSFYAGIRLEPISLLALRLYTPWDPPEMIMFSAIH